LAGFGLEDGDERAEGNVVAILGPLFGSEQSLISAPGQVIHAGLQFGICFQGQEPPADSGVRHSPRRPTSRSRAGAAFAVSMRKSSHFAGKERRGLAERKPQRTLPLGRQSAARFEGERCGSECPENRSERNGELADQQKGEACDEKSWGSRIRTWFPGVHVALERHWVDAGKASIAGVYDSTCIGLHCGRIGLTSPMVLPICCQILIVQDLQESGWWPRFRSGTSRPASPW